MIFETCILMAMLIGSTAVLRGVVPGIVTLGDAAEEVRLAYIKDLRRVTNIYRRMGWILVLVLTGSVVASLVRFQLGWLSPKDLVPTTLVGVGVWVVRIVFKRVDTYEQLLRAAVGANRTKKPKPATKV